MKRNSCVAIGIPLTYLFLFAAIAWSLLATSAIGQTYTDQVASGLTNPLYGTFAPGDTSRLFMLEQGSTGTARIKTLDLDDGTVSTFLTITGLRTTGEQGLLGLAFHPDYANNGFFYLYTTIFGGPTNRQSQISRYTAIGDPLTATSADPASFFPLLTFSQPFSNHNGGWMSFNPQVNGAENGPQYLYIASGDGGDAGDPFNNGQTIDGTFLGKMLRIDVDGDDFPADPDRNYSIPPDNPFVGVTGDDEIWAYGLRNPWRNSFDRATGDLWIADVGQDDWEEIDFQPASSPGGENYGWRVMEGNSCFDNSQFDGNPPCFDSSFTPPVYNYAHGFGSFNGNSVTGGYVYRGSVAQYEGLYMFADFELLRIWTIDPYAVDVADSAINRVAELPPDAGALSGIASFGEDAMGEVYVFSYLNGQVFRISTTSQQAVWNGDDPGAGNSGDGSSWSDANNWTRGGTVDTGFVSKDEVVFDVGSSVSTINLEADRTVAGVRFLADYTLQGNTLTVLSGNIRVAPGVTATIDSELSAETVNTSLRKLDGGRLNLNGAIGQTVVLEGTVGGTGTFDYLTVYDGGQVAPGASIGQINVTNDYRQLAGATLEMEIGSPGPEPNDMLAVSGSAELDGTLAIVPDPSYQDPAARGEVDSFELLTASETAGVFEEVVYDGQTLVPTFGPDGDGSFRTHVGDGLFRGITYAETDVTVYNYYALGGDANGDGTVDGIDFVVWNSFKFTGGTDWLSGDFNGDGFTDGQDFTIWNANKFTSVVLPSSVPEPQGFVLLIAALLAMRPRIRRVSAR